jgi:ubiquinone/menaquinone biosynthesis C-methylase UbiE
MAHVCPWWLTYLFDNPLRTLFHRPEEVVGPFVEPGAVAVDVGCGRGWFALGLARLVGREGEVWAVDRQERLLRSLADRARRRGLEGRIRTHAARAPGLGLEGLAGRAGFILAFWMLHEVDRPAGLLSELAGMLAPEGSLLLAEPKGHVDPAGFERLLEAATRSGLSVSARPPVRLSRAALLRRG